jgi:FAD/FMN-containing dehydrogenase
VCPVSTADVVETVRFARERGLRIHVLATGHGTVVPIRSGLVVSVRRLTGLEIDPARRRARMGGGTRWDAVIAEAGRSGLAPVAGASGTVGAVGLLLGGGLGPLARSHGFGSDSWVRATVVDGSGKCIEASKERASDLLWALRGGGEPPGIVTELEVGLAELPTLFGGSLVFAETEISAAFRGWLEWTRTAHPRLTTSAAIARFPADAGPPPFRGKRILHLRFAYPGPADEGERLAAPLRRLGSPVMDDIHEMPPTDIARIHGDPTEPTPTWFSGSMLSRIDDDLATRVLAEVGPGSEGPFSMGEIRHLGEQTTRDVPEGSAVGGRSGLYTLSLLAMRPGPVLAELPVAARRFHAALGPWRAPETNVNFLGESLAPEVVPRCWPPEITARLAEIRRRHGGGLFGIATAEP